MDKVMEERLGNVRNAMIRHMYSSSQKDGRWSTLCRAEYLPYISCPECMHWSCSSS